MDLTAARAQWDAVPGYCNAATLGLPPVGVRRALVEAVQDWGAGRADAHDYDRQVRRARTLFAQVVGVPSERVCVGSQASVMAGTIAASLPDGARVVCVAGDFTSVVFPFVVQEQWRAVSVEHVPLTGLADAVGQGCDLVVFSLVQSADGALADVDAVREAAARVGAATFCDLTQAVGWLPVRAGDFDYTVTSAYKWLCAPRGVAFGTVAAHRQEDLVPVNAGWYAGQDVWGSVYGPDMALADDARRFDVSPAWLPWAGAVPALELFADLDLGLVCAHDAGLADQVLAGLGLPTAGRAVVTVPDPSGDVLARLRAAGVTAVARAGSVRLAFHLWNDAGDVDTVLSALDRSSRLTVPDVQGLHAAALLEAFQAHVVQCWRAGASGVRARLVEERVVDPVGNRDHQGPLPPALSRAVVKDDMSSAHHSASSGMTVWSRPSRLLANFSRYARG